VEGTVVYERIYHEAGAQTAMHMSYLELVRLIRGAGSVRSSATASTARCATSSTTRRRSLAPARAALPVVHAA
jgi:hypothetical protein